MSVPRYNPMQAFRRFVGLRSAWRRSLALEPSASAPSAQDGACPIRDDQPSRPGARSHRAKPTGHEPAPADHCREAICCCHG